MNLIALTLLLHSLKPLPFVTDTPAEHINRRASIWSRNNFRALQERQRWVNRMNARLRSDGVIFITPKVHHTHRRKK